MSSLASNRLSRLSSAEKAIQERVIKLLTKIENHKATCTDPNCHLEVALRA